MSSYSPSDNRLRLYLDTADVSAWQQWLPTGIFYGVTTNPLLLERADIACTLNNLKMLSQKAFTLGAQEVQMQAWGPTVGDLVETGLQIAALDRKQRIVVKVPVTEAGCAAASQLVSAKVRVTVTAVYEVSQVILGTLLQAEYAAPYLGRINDLGRNGRAVLTEMQTMTGLTSGPRLLVASIREVEDILALAHVGLRTFTISPAIAEALFKVSATLQATAEFERAANAERTSIQS
jgi:transaldolase